MKRIIKSISTAMLAQGISLVLSVFMSFYVSGYMTIEAYGYYQLFLFYSTYVGILQFGVSEGMYLQNGGKAFRDINKQYTKSVFSNILFLQIVLLAAIFTVVNIFLTNHDKKYVIILTLLFTVIYYIVTYFGYLLQAANRIERYSLSVIIGKAVTFILFIILVKKGLYQFKYYCLAYLAGYLSMAVIIIYACKDIIGADIHRKWLVSKNILISGGSLLFSNLISSFIVGVNRIYIDSVLGIEAFGKVSMALSLSNFIVLFAIQVGLVIFPNLVNMTDDKKIILYKRMKFILGYFSPMILIGYIPLKYILEMWIPQYIESIKWLLLLVPYTVYEIKNQILYNTYMKAFRLEKVLFKVNTLVFIFCAIVNFFVVIYTKNIEYMLLVLSLAVIFKSVFLDKRLCEVLKIRNGFITRVEAVSCMMLAYLSYHEFKACWIITIGIYFLYSISYLYEERRNRFHKICVGRKK